jgi:hypothetical protein
MALGIQTRLAVRPLAEAQLARWPLEIAAEDRPQGGAADREPPSFLLEGRALRAQEFVVGKPPGGETVAPVGDIEADGPNVDLVRRQRQ